MSRRDAALKTMEEVGGALVSIALVLCAVFVPTAFLGGISGQFFQQFAVTIAVAHRDFLLLFADACRRRWPRRSCSRTRTSARRQAGISSGAAGTAFTGVLQPRLRPAVARLCQRRRLRDPACRR